MEIKNVTLCFLRRNDEVLLAMKKRDFGKGKWNGAGGKLLDGESFEDAAVREVKEEIGVIVHQEDLCHVALLDFYFEGEKKHEPLYAHHCQTYITEKWEGEPQESEEMKPKWFHIPKLPFETMWSDDKLWLPRVLAGERLHAEFWFDTSFHHTRYCISPLKQNKI